MNDVINISWVTYVIVCPLVFLAGMIDAAAGGGGLISLPAYLIAGLPSLNAIGTNKLSSAMGTTVATAKYARSGFVPWKPALGTVFFALGGSFLGARLALFVGDTVFKYILMAVLPVTALFVVKGRILDREREAYSDFTTIAISIPVAFVIGIYDGFYGPGTGTFLILLLTFVAHMNIKTANGITKVINLTTNITALAVYLFSGKTIIVLGLVAGMFSILGNYLGSRFFIKGGVKFAKPMILVVISIFWIKIIVEML